MYMYTRSTDGGPGHGLMYVCIYIHTHTHTHRHTHTQHADTHTQPYFYSGTMAFNYAMDVADTIPYAQRTSKSSQTMPNHLDQMREANSISPQIMFAHSTGKFATRLYFFWPIQNSFK